MTEGKSKQLTIRDVSPSLLSAMDIRKRQLGVSRDTLLRSILELEFERELELVRRERRET